ncbi:MAG: hypothetical protein M0011_09375 [Elusimicrobia bacterium]|nr:hypothetical protein [Elusimicrobiota bacterium]
MRRPAALLLLPFLPALAAAQLIVFQPSHQSDTGENYNEALTCNAIVEYAMAAEPRYGEKKVWSYFQPGLHHADTGTNTLKAHTSDIEDGKISGYAWELARSNEIKPLFFIGVHNNGGSGRHAVWGYIHDGDNMEAENRRLSDILIEEIARATDLENRGTHLDSSTGRNDYRCASTGRLAFYSIDENVNKAPYRVLLEIGDSEKSRAFLISEDGRRAVGEAIKRGLARFFKSEGISE